MNWKRLRLTLLSVTLVLFSLAGCLSSPGGQGVVDQEVAEQQAVDQSPAEESFATVVYLLRHAEKVDDGSSDPALSARGVARSIALAKMLADQGIEHILSTPFVRTRSTVTPLSQEIGVSVELMEVSGLEAHIEEMAGVVEAAPGVKFLIVGHSNTVPLVIARLGGPQFEINEDQYGDLFVLKIGEAGVEFRRERYGD